MGSSAGGRGVPDVSSISINVSALEPRYGRLQQEGVMQRLVPRVQDLARQSARLGIQLTIDAEEADRLDLSLDIIEALAKDPATKEWPGLGLAVQAYGQRTLEVIDWGAATAGQVGRRRAV